MEFEISAELPKLSSTMTRTSDIPLASLLSLTGGGRQVIDHALRGRVSGWAP
jgi:hypothetical protein